MLRKLWTQCFKRKNTVDEESPSSDLKPAKTDSPSLVTNNSTSTMAITHHLLPSSFATLIAQTVIGMFRDSVWGYDTLTGINYKFLRSLPPLVGTTITQMIRTAPSMLISIALIDIIYSKYNPTLMHGNWRWLKEKLIPLAFSSWSSIPAFNIAQYAGSKLGLELGMTAENASYFSSPFCGIAETVWQNALIIPKLAHENFSLLLTMLNMLTGTVWQFVLQINASAYNTQNGEDRNAAIATGAEIALSVAITTLFMALLFYKIRGCNNSSSAHMADPNEETPLENHDCHSRYLMISL